MIISPFEKIYRLTNKIQPHTTNTSATLNTAKWIALKSNMSTTNPLTALSIKLPIPPVMIKTSPILAAIDFTLPDNIKYIRKTIKAVVAIIKKIRPPSKILKAAPVSYTHLDVYKRQALNMVIKLSETEDVTLVNSVNPYRLQGQKTAAFEICDDLNKAPEYLLLPVGNAGNISAYWMGFKEYYCLLYTSRCV